MQAWRQGELPELPNSAPEEELLALGLGMALSWQVWVCPEAQLCFSVASGMKCQPPVNAGGELRLGIQSRS